MRIYTAHLSRTGERRVFEHHPAMAKPAWR